MTKTLTMHVSVHIDGTAALEGCEALTLAMTYLTVTGTAPDVNVAGGKLVWLRGAFTQELTGPNNAATVQDMAARLPFGQIVVGWDGCTTAPLDLLRDDLTVNLPKLLDLMATMPELRFKVPAEVGFALPDVLTQPVPAKAGAVERVGGPDDLIEDFLKVSARAFNGLKNDNIYCRGLLLTYSADELLRIPNFGKKSLTEVKEALAAQGWTLGEPVDGWRPLAYPDDVPNTRGITLNGEIATKAQVLALDGAYRDNFRYYRIGDWLHGKIPLKDKLNRGGLRNLLLARVLPTDVVGGWTPFVTLADKPATETQLEVLNMHLTDALPGLPDELNRRYSYVGEVVNWPANQWQQWMNGKPQQLYELMRRADFPTSLDGPYVVGWLAPE